jgi:hypothetical protein
MCRRRHWPGDTRYTRRRDTTPKSKKLTATEKIIADFILELDARAFPPRLSGD